MNVIGLLPWRRLNFRTLSERIQTDNTAWGRIFLHEGIPNTAYHWDGTIERSNAALPVFVKGLTLEEAKTRVDTRLKELPLAPYLL